MEKFSFGNINASSKKHILNVETVDKIVLLDKTEGHELVNKFPVMVLVEEYLNQEEIDGLYKFFCDNHLYRVKIIYVLNCIVKNKADIQKDQKEGIINFFINNKSNFESELIEGAPILTLGPALYSLVQENDILPNHVQQRLFSPSNFWFSKDLTRKNAHRVFPLESFNDLFADYVSNKEAIERANSENRQNTKPKFSLLDTDKSKSEKSSKSSQTLKKITPYVVDSFKVKLAKLQIGDCLKFGGQDRPLYKKLNKVFISSSEEFDTLFYEPNKDRHDEVLAWDIETSGLNFLKDTIGCITLSFDGKTGYYIPWKYVNKRKLNYILSRNRQCGANLKYDEKYLWKNGVPAAWTDEDVIVLGHCLDETRSNSLKSLAFYFSEYGGYERPLDVYKKKTGVKNYLTIPENLLREYAVMDAIVTWRVWNNMMNHVKLLERKYPNDIYKNDGFLSYYYDRCIPASNMYARIEYRGFYINKDKLDALRIVMKKFISDTKEKLSEIFGVSKDFNWDSNQKLGNLLEKKGWEDLGRVSSGEYQVSDFQLVRWDKTHHEEVKLIQDLKHVSTLLNGFVGEDNDTSNSLDLVDNDDDDSKGWARYLTYHPEDNSWRMHANYFSMGTDSGRTRCKAPNLQNTPTRGKFAEEIKSCVCTPDDDNFYLVTVDYSSLQMRLAAIDTDPTFDEKGNKICSIDKNLYDAFWTPHIDMHSKTAYLSFCSEKEFDVETITVEQDGKTYKFLGGETVVTKEGKEILARNLTEQDEIKVG